MEQLNSCKKEYNQYKHNHKPKITVNCSRPIILAILLFAFIGNIARAQSQQNGYYTQYMDNLTPINPAYSLLDKTGSLNGLVRKQYVGIQGAPTTVIFNGSIPFEDISGAAGLVVSNNSFAVETNTQINAFFAKSIPLTETDNLAVSLSAGFRRYVANYSSLDATDPLFTNDVRETKPNLGFGVMYYSDSYYIGLSVPELTLRGLGTASVQDNANFKNHYYLAAGYLATLGEDIKVKTAGLASYSQGTPAIGDVSAIFYLKQLIGIGINFRTNSQAAGIFSVNTNNFRLGYSYQFSPSNNTPGAANNSTQEITLTYRFGSDIQGPKLL